MKYREWKNWVKSLPWSLRWFVYLLLLRPIIDNFYHLKNISPFLSPLYIVGVLTPILIFFAIMLQKKPAKSTIDTIFLVWGFVAVGSCCFICINGPKIIVLLQFILKLTMPFYIYFFARLLIRTRQDFHGVLQTFLYSCIFVISLFLYEVVIGPIRVEHSRGLERIQGNFADSMNYSIYLTFGFLIFCYFNITKKGVVKPLKGIKNTLMIGGICLLCLVKIHHTASYGVFFVLVLIYFIYTAKVNKGAVVVILVFVLSISFAIGKRILTEKITPLIETDLAVYRGEKSTDRLFHGRMYRWKKMWKVFSDLNLLSWVFGVPIELKQPYAYITGGPHNDFMRILFFTGYIGLFSYLSLLILIAKKLFYLESQQQFLGLGCMVILILFSITTCPTLYVVVLYIICSLFAYLALPYQLRRSS